ncbi:aminotransferase class V-fold PLP-dependent enzyme [Neptunicella marina]|uniref:Aminotransferase class V-fold PLP-dependent enzyme n=1 Tax=Neptunicella marina TaxID=2125989 RepID=A0A8J6IUF9_9ALTE|nr:aminotransferase class V-fold PLP-dependent enzyme [Neptunicella marina]MBC3765843.1 aminotransferase class V-fold PLP-dependent enzyme [Neptunicella marina]
MYQHLYQGFLNANKNIQHFACHSHHYWPDVTRQAMLDYWDDTARLVDDKWGYFFEHKVPALQQHIATILNTGEPEQLVFASNTHELLFRIISCLDLCKPLKILTTDSEFHSFNRQVNRLDELSNVHVNKVPCLPFESFESRFIQQAQSDQYDLIFVSQVFFNSGYAISDLDALVTSIADHTDLLVIDGYHAFMALPTSLKNIKDKIFYLAGGYKYAQGGEGACFAHIPRTAALRPLYTGWYAEFGALANSKGLQVDYADNGMAFAGSTMDYSAQYRMLAVFDLFAGLQLGVPAIHQYVMDLQQAFLEQLQALNHPHLNLDNLLLLDKNWHGHFLTFKLPSAELVASIAGKLKAHGIHTDYRGDRLRFGFALYQNADEFDLGCLKQIKD